MDDALSARIADMHASMARFEASDITLADVRGFGFKGDTLVRLQDALRKLLGDLKSRLFVHFGLDDEGKVEAWLETRDGDGNTVSADNVSHTCPPDCD